MNLPSIFLNRQFKRAVIIVAILTLVYLVMNIFLIGGDAFIYSFNSFVNAPLAICNALFAASILRHLRSKKQPRVLWAGLIAGWALWALAETIWIIYSLLNQEVPYPSLADLFWLVGYIPMGIGLLAQIRTMPTRPNRMQNYIIGVSTAAIILVTFFFVFMPIFQYFDAQRLTESILNIIYPLADLFLVVIVGRLFFTFEKGDYGFAWRLLIVGFLFMIFSDLVFTYATWQGLYYPNSVATLLSRLVIDAPYTVSYLLWFLGIYAIRLILSEPLPVEPAIQPKRVTAAGHILAYTRGNGSVISASPNFSLLFGAEPEKGTSLAAALGLPEQECSAIQEKLRKEGKVADLPLQVRNLSGALQEVKLCGVAIYGLQKEYAGGNILLVLPVDDNSFDLALDKEARAMVGYLLEKSGSNYKAEVGRFLLEYHLAYLKVLFNTTFHQGGELMSQSLLEHLRATSNEHAWQLQFNPQTILEDAGYPLEVLREALPVLIRSAGQFASRMTDPVTVASQIKGLGSQFSEAVQKDVERFMKPGSEIRFSDQPHPGESG